MKRFGMFLLIMIGFGLVATLYVIKTRTQTAAYEVRRLQQTLEQEHVAITVLNAEIAHLESPERLAKLSKVYLDLEPTKPEQIKTLDAVILAVPRRAAEPEGAK